MPLFLHALGLVPTASRGGAAGEWAPRLLLYGHLSPSPPSHDPWWPKRRRSPAWERSVPSWKKRCSTSKKSNATLQGALQDQERTLHQIQQAQQAAERERQAAMQAQEHRLEEILKRAQHAQRPPQAPAPPPVPDPAAAARTGRRCPSPPPPKGVDGFC